MVSLATVPAPERHVIAGDGPKHSGDEQRHRNMGQDPLIDLPSGTDKAAILDGLASVLDPELDQSILSLGFVRSISLRDFHATVTLQLPTSWCAINFTFIMAEDVRSALLARWCMKESVRCIFPSWHADHRIRADAGMPSAVIRLSTLHPIFASVR
jgi:metal-sulfur cluster biosynthetic enzyme